MKIFLRIDTSGISTATIIQVRVLQSRAFWTKSVQGFSKRPIHTPPTPPQAQTFITVDSIGKLL